MNSGEQIDYHLHENSGVGKNIGIVKALWNSNITTKLYSSCHDTLIKHGVNAKNIYTLEVPGSFELIYGAKKILKKQHLDAVIVIGSIIKGETPHFEFISRTIINAIMNISLDYNKPIGNGVLTCLNFKQARKRAFDKKKGTEATKALISVLSQK